jgi:hypothetical protein
VLLSEVIHLILKALIGLLKIEQPGLKLPPMGNARLSTETR